MHNNHLQYENETNSFPLGCNIQNLRELMEKGTTSTYLTIFPKKNKGEKIYTHIVQPKAENQSWRLSDLFIQMDEDIIAMKISQAKISIESENRREEYRSCENRLGFAASGIYNPEQMQLDGVEGNGKSILPNSRRQQSFWRNNIAVSVPIIFLCC